MPRSSTTYPPKWKLGKTTVIRVPKKLAPALLRYARELDQTSDASDLHGPAGAHRTPEPAASGPRNSASAPPHSASRQSPVPALVSPGKTKLRCDIRARFSFPCPFCGKRYENDEERCGLGVTCPNCNHFFYIPKVPGKTAQYAQRRRVTHNPHSPPPDVQGGTLKLRKRSIIYHRKQA